MSLSLLSAPLRKAAALLLVFNLTLSAGAEEIKVGTVNKVRLLNEFHLTKTAEAEEAVERKAMKADDAERMESMQAIANEMKKFQAVMEDTSLAEAKRREAQQKLMEHRQTLQALGRERETASKARRSNLNQKMVSIMNEIRLKVVNQVHAYAETTDVDYVFDESGLTTAQVPFLLFARKKVDLTEEVLKLLNKDHPTPPKEAPKDKE